MNEMQNRYIRNQILTMPMNLNRELTHKKVKFNKRSDYETVKTYIDDFLKGENINRFLVLPGLRDVGKTTILFQIYEYLLKEKEINSRNILYFSCDRLKKTGNADIFNIITSYLETYHNSLIETLPYPVFILIDEAQHDKQWALNGKLIFDGSKNIFMIFTGSSALKLTSNPDAARRLLNIPVHPLNYSEHLRLKYGNFKNDISHTIIQMIFDGKMQNSLDLERKIMDIYSNFKNYNVSEWKNYLQFGGFPSSFYQKNKDITKKIINMVDKVVTTDMNDIEGINTSTQNLAFQILNFLAFQNPGEISKGSLSNRFDAKIGLVSKVLNILEKTQLIFHIESFTSSVKRTTKPHEYFFATPSLKHNLALDIGIATLENEKAYMGKLLETYVASNFHNLDNRSPLSYKIYYDDAKKNSKKNVDFIVQRGMENPIPIEVSYGKKDKSQIKPAISKYKSPHGIIISDNEKIKKEENIIYLPHEIFAFM